MSEAFECAMPGIQAICDEDFTNVVPVNLVNKKDYVLIMYAVTRVYLRVFYCGQNYTIFFFIEVLKFLFKLSV